MAGHEQLLRLPGDAGRVLIHRAKLVSPISGSPAFPTLQGLIPGVYLSALAGSSQDEASSASSYN